MAICSIFEEDYMFYIEIDFDGLIPDSSTREDMKRHGFRWNPSKKVWWSYYGDDAYECAEEICGYEIYNEVADEIEMGLLDGDNVECPHCKIVYHTNMFDCPKCGYSYDVIVSGMKTGRYKDTNELIQEYNRDYKEFSKMSAEDYEREREIEYLRRTQKETYKVSSISAGMCRPR